MSTTKAVTIWCDAPGCNEWNEDNRETVADARQVAKRLGWTYRNGRDLCPYEGTADVEIERHDHA